MRRIGQIVALLLIIFLLLPLAEERQIAKVELEHGQSDTLIVLLHAFTKDGSSLTAIRNELQREGSFAGADVLQPDLPFGVFSMATTSEVVAQLLVVVDEAWAKRAAEGRPYKNILLVGHSMGALIARKVYVAAHGQSPDAEFEPLLIGALRDSPSLDTPRPWADKVSKIILFAGMNRGWSISHHMSLWRAFYMQAGVAAGHLLEVFYGRQPIVMEIRRGAPFVTQLRLQWLSMENHLNPKAEVVQMLGTQDDLVAPDDNVDLVVGDDFRYVPVPYSNHENVIDLNEQKLGEYRKQALRLALAPDVVSPVAHDPCASKKIRIDCSVNHVVFVMHGIRDQGHWTHQIARRIETQFRDRFGADVVVESETSSYGYFPMLSFLQPGARREKVEWFMDRYVEARVRYPRARFHYVGHSHGTYLLAEALESYASVEFDHVVFAGSVVQRDYDWSRYTPERVHAILNFVATADWVVAFFPKALQSIGVQDLGSAGHDGFDSGRVVQPRALYVKGGHSAALQEQVWDSIAEFVVSGKFVPPPEGIEPKQNPWIKYPAYGAILIWLLIALALMAIYIGLLRLRLREWKKTLIIVGYVWFVWTVLTEV